jgi:hypothetical protein
VQTGCTMGIKCLYYGTRDFNNESLLQNICAGFVLFIGLVMAAVRLHLAQTSH